MYFIGVLKQSSCFSLWHKGRRNFIYDPLRWKFIYDPLRCTLFSWTPYFHSKTAAFRKSFCTLFLENPLWNPTLLHFHLKDRRSGCSIIMIICNKSMCFHNCAWSWGWASSPSLIFLKVIYPCLQVTHTWFIIELLVRQGVQRRKHALSFTS